MIVKQDVKQDVSVGIYKRSDLKLRRKNRRC